MRKQEREGRKEMIVFQSPSLQKKKKKKKKEHNKDLSSLRIDSSLPLWQYCP